MMKNLSSLSFVSPKFVLSRRSPLAWFVMAGSLILSPMVANLSAIAQTPEQPLMGVTVKVPGGGCLNARKTPSPYGEIYDCIENNSVLKPIIGEENGWYQLSSGGWVMKKYTSLPNIHEIPDTPEDKPTHPVSATHLQYIPNNPMKGEAVRKLQMKLNEHRVLDQPLVVDGVFGLTTKQAVEALQRRHGLTVDGIVGDATRAILKL